MTIPNIYFSRLPYAFTMKFVDGTVRRGITIRQHNSYIKQNFDNDIAIIEMDSNVDFDEGLVKRVCLPTEGNFTNYYITCKQRDQKN